MKKIILLIFLVSCAGTKIYEKQMEEQRKQIEELQQIKEIQEKDIKNLFVRLRRNKKAMKLMAESFSAKPLIVTKTVCTEDNGEEICIDLLSEK